MRKIASSNSKTDNLERGSTFRSTAESPLFPLTLAALEGSPGFFPFVAVGALGPEHAICAVAMSETSA